MRMRTVSRKDELWTKEIQRSGSARSPGLTPPTMSGEEHRVTIRDAGLPRRRYCTDHSRRRIRSWAVTQVSPGISTLPLKDMSGQRADGGSTDGGSRNSARLEWKKATATCDKHEHQSHAPPRLIGAYPHAHRWATRQCEQDFHVPRRSRRCGRPMRFRALSARGRPC